MYGVTAGIAMLGLMASGGAAVALVVYRIWIGGVGVALCPPYGVYLWFK